MLSCWRIVVCCCWMEEQASSNSFCLELSLVSLGLSSDQNVWKLLLSEATWPIWELSCWMACAMSGRSLSNSATEPCKASILASVELLLEWNSVWKACRLVVMSWSCCEFWLICGRRCCKQFWKMGRHLCYSGSEWVVKWVKKESTL